MKNVEKRPCQSYRSRPYHTDELTPALQEVKQQCADVQRMSDIDDETIEKILNIYASDITVDLYNIAESLGMSYSTVGTTFRSPKWRDKYREAKRKRAAVTTSKMLQISAEPYDMFKRGEEPTYAFIKAADLHAKYLAFVAQKTDPDLQQGSAAQTGPLYVNTVVKIKDLSVPRVEHQIIEGRCEVNPEDGSD